VILHLWLTIDHKSKITRRDRQLVRDGSCQDPRSMRALTGMTRARYVAGGRPDVAVTMSSCT